MLINDTNLLRAVTQYDPAGRPMGSHSATSANPKTSNFVRLANGAVSVQSKLVERLKMLKAGIGNFHSVRKNPSLWLRV